MKNYEIHPYAEIFPALSEDKLSELAADIKTNGLNEPIILYEKKILDGRNRYLACKIAGVKPTYHTYCGDNPLAYVISANVHRRHLNESRRAVIAARLANMRQGERTDIEHSANLPKVISQSQAAKMLNVSERTLRTIRAIKQKRPTLIDEIVEGKLSAGKAYQDIKGKEQLERIKQLAQAKAKAPAEEVIPDLILADPPWRYDFSETDTRKILAKAKSKNN